MKSWNDTDVKMAVVAAFVLIYSFGLWVTGR